MLSANNYFKKSPVKAIFKLGAPGGNRTLVSCLKGSYSTIELQGRRNS